MESLREVWRVARDRKLDEMAKDKKNKKKSDRIDKLKYMPDFYREDYIKDMYTMARLSFRMSGIQHILAYSQEMGAIAKRDELKSKIKALEKKLGFRMKGGVIPSSKEGNKSPDKEKKTAARAKDKEDKHQGR